MLAPLKEGSLFKVGGGGSIGRRVGSEQASSPAEDFQHQRKVLRESGKKQRYNALESARRIAALSHEVSRLAALCARYRLQLARYESGVTVIELGRKLMQLREKNEQLSIDAHCMWTLERTIDAAHAEYSRMSRERDALADELSLSRLERVSIIRS